MNANEWLSEYLAGLKGDKLQRELKDLIDALEEDVIEELYEDEMTESGYNDHLYMTYAKACEEFKETIEPLVVAQYGRDDDVALREEFNNWTDYLCKDGRITSNQYNTWDNPY